jgi:hypothetical protein
MFSLFAPWCVQTRISASACEGEKPHQGVASQNPAPFPGWELSNSRTALGLALWAGKTVSGPAVAANNGRVPSNITCSTVLPNGQTVGGVVQSVTNQINNSTSTMSTAYGPAPQYNSGPSPLSVPSFVYSQINFKIMFQGQGGADFLGDAGNFAYGAISANLGVPLSATEAVAGLYAVWAQHPDTNGPFWMDFSATTQVPAGYKAKCGG